MTMARKKVNAELESSGIEQPWVYVAGPQTIAVRRIRNSWSPLPLPRPLLFWFRKPSFRLESRSCDSPGLRVQPFFSLYSRCTCTQEIQSGETGLSGFWHYLAAFVVMSRDKRPLILSVSLLSRCVYLSVWRSHGE